MRTVRAAVGGRRGDGLRLGRQARRARQEAEKLGGQAGRAGGLAVERARPADPFARRAAHPSEAACDRRHGEGRRASRSSATSSCSGARRRARARFVAITGTNGKSTTTALIGHVLAAAGLRGLRRRQYRPRRARPGGAGGGPRLRARDVVLPARPDALFPAGRRGLAEPHARPSRPARRHGGLSRTPRRASSPTWARTTPRWSASTSRRCRRSRPSCSGAGRPKLRTVSVGAPSRTRRSMSTRSGAPDRGRPREVASFAALPTLRGAHNWQNAAMAWGAARALGLTATRSSPRWRASRAWRTAWRSLGRRGRVLFVNDSKATNADAAAKALATFEPIYWIAGGQAKEGGIEPLAEFFPRIAKAYLIGAAADAFSAHARRARAARHRRRPARRPSGWPLPTPRSTRRRSRRSCSRPPAPPSTSSPISRRAARRSGAPSLRSMNSPWRRSHDQPRAPLAAFRLVVDRRPGDALARPAAAAERPGALLRRQPAGGRAARARQPAFRAAPRRSTRRWRRRS